MENGRMCSIIGIVVFAFVTQAHCKELAEDYPSEMQGAPDTSVDNLVDRGLKVRPIHADLDGTMLGKTSRLAISSHAAMPSRISVPTIRRPKSGGAMRFRISIPCYGASVIKARADDGNSAPFLREYFENILEFYEKDLGASFAERLELDYEARMEEQYTILREKCRNAMTKSFNRHDADKNGILDKEEAKVFFSNVVAEGSRFQEAVSVVALQAALQKNCEAGREDGQRHCWFPKRSRCEDGRGQSGYCGNG
eukprot:gnl/TRDRNA2_/TRDRNA2_175197_c0_seq1.p1 gnl/TRDRNA2_/TRDRNA2_175197_c0~~gnl/TRDRNA2_/TRDRNA2_175197_c0_seq1.p1  ORF type:complete len:253 (-),score=32.17 gnl/TRDRNA2_/TRDRNA2_175197_c0_seq1:399-1157(-)